MNLKCFNKYSKAVEAPTFSRCTGTYCCSFRRAESSPSLLLEIHTACCKYQNFQLCSLAITFCFKNTDRICSLYMTESRSSVYFPPFITRRTQFHYMYNTLFTVTWLRFCTIFFSKPFSLPVILAAPFRTSKKGKVIPLQARCGPEGGQRYSSTLP